MNTSLNIIVNKNRFNFIFIYEFQSPLTSFDRFLQYQCYPCLPGPSLPQTHLFILGIAGNQLGIAQLGAHDVATPTGLVLSRNEGVLTIIRALFSLGIGFTFETP